MFTTPDLIRFTRCLCAKQGNPIDDWSDDRVLALAREWGFEPALVSFTPYVEQHQGRLH